MIPFDEAKQNVKLMAKRVALLHIAYARTLIAELGKNQGTQLCSCAIKAYGKLVGNEVRKRVLELGLPLTPGNYGIGKSRSLPSFGVHEERETVKIGGEKRIRAYGCALAKVWQDQKEQELGRLYCYVDPAKYMAYNPDYKLVHTKTLPDGDSYCEFCIRRTTAEERGAFASEHQDWFFIDKCD